MSNHQPSNTRAQQKEPKMYQSLSACSKFYDIFRSSHEETYLNRITLFMMWGRTNNGIFVRTTHVNIEFCEKGLEQFAAKYNLTRHAKLFKVKF